jgi:hypothetical protein
MTQREAIVECRVTCNHLTDDHTKGCPMPPSARASAWELYGTLLVTLTLPNLVLDTNLKGQIPKTPIRSTEGQGNDADGFANG